jgi:hypothetical protein
MCRLTVVQQQQQRIYQLHTMSTKITLFILVALLCCMDANAWTSNSKAFRVANRQKRSESKFILPQKPSQGSSVTQQNMLKNPGSSRSMNSARKQSTKLSNSVLADCDTLPSFPTAHGLLSPETVMRMEELAVERGHQNPALRSFLHTYRKSGPMSCLSMLSDPDVLPSLTEAMRDIAV